jgi:7 transmembrane receptor (rhodopsin family)
MTNVTGYPHATANDTALKVEDRYPGITLYEHFTPQAVWCGRVLLIIWLVVGLPGNALSAKIWLEKRMRNSSAIYIAAMSINCVVFLVLHAFSALKFLWGIPLYHYPVACELMNAFYIMPQYLNQLLILGFTVDRYIAVCFPLRRRDYCRPSRAVKVSIVPGCSDHCARMRRLDCLYCRLDDCIR